MMRRVLCAGLVLLGSATAAFAQLGQQQQEDLGIMSAPPTGTAGVTGAQQTAPLQIPPTQSPVITNNPTYPTQPLGVPSPYSPYQLPGQLQQQQGVAAPGQARPQTPAPAPAQPRQSATEQRGRGAFTAPGVTRELTGERSEFQDFIWASTGQVLPLF